MIMKVNLILKKGFSLLALFLFLYSCGSKGKKDNTILEEVKDSISVAEEADTISDEIDCPYQNDEIKSEYSCLPSDVVNASYKIISKESGYYYCISINGKEYRISDMIDYGELDMKVYANSNSSLLLIGLTDFYASVYFVYYFKDDVLTRLGQVDIDQPDDVEEHGVRKISFDVIKENDKIKIESYLDGDLACMNEFLWNNQPE